MEENKRGFSLSEENRSLPQKQLTIERPKLTGQQKSPALWQHQAYPVLSVGIGDIGLKAAISEKSLLGKSECRERLRVNGLTVEPFGEALEDSISE
ncbi:MAG: hypothetical protein ACU4EQ_03350 [Candidatus Nitrosoglobus sp.]|jgi:hypothetical protein